MDFFTVKKQNTSILNLFERCATGGSQRSTSQRGPSRKNSPPDNGSCMKKIVIPDIITVKFKTDYNIHHVDRIIRAKFNRDIEDIPRMIERIKELTENSNRAYTIIEHKTILSKISDIRARVNSIELREDIDYYNTYSAPLLARYDAIPKSNVTVDISNNNSDDVQELTPADSERIEVIIDYLEIANKFIEIDLIHEHNQSDNHIYCRNCDYIIDNVAVSSEGQQICPSCFTERYVSKKTKILESCSDVLTNCKEYSDKQNFKKAFYRYMGLQNTTFDIHKVCSILDTYFVANGHRPGEYYKALPYNSRGKKDGTSLSIMIDGLKATKQPQLYEDSNLIAHYLWGWKLPDLLHLEKTIMDDYDATQAVYDSMTLESRDRKSCLSTQFRLFKHLQLRGCNVDIEDFKIPSQRESLYKHDTLWKQMCDGCNNPSIYYIPTL